MLAQEPEQRSPMSRIRMVKVDDVVSQLHDVPYVRSGGFEAATEVREGLLDLLHGVGGHATIGTDADLACCRDEVAWSGRLGYVLVEGRGPDFVWVACED